MDRPLHIAGVRRSAQPPGPAAWGRPVPLLHASIAEIHEKPFIEKVLNDLHYRSSIFNLKDLEIENALLRREVELREYRKELRGDIDILVIPQAHPELSTAIQVKRFKVGQRAVRTGRPNGFVEFKKGIRQSNLLAELGFSQVYLWVFVLVDTREQNGGRYAYDGPDAELNSRIDQAISPVGLDPRVGLMSFEWVQPIDRAPLELGTYHGHLRRLATKNATPAALGAWLASLR